MKLLAWVLIFAWLNEGVGKVEERHTFDTLAACEAAKQQKIAEKIIPDNRGLLHSLSLHAECREF